MKNKKILKIGGSLYVAIEPYLVKELKLKEGDKVNQTMRNGNLIVKKIKEDKEGGKDSIPNN